MKREAQIKRLEELRRKATVLDKQMEILLLKAQEITKDDKEDGYTFDYIYNGFGTAEELLSRGT